MQVKRWCKMIGSCQNSYLLGTMAENYGLWNAISSTKIVNFYMFFIEVCYKSVIDEKSSLVETMAWYRKSDTPLLKAMLTQFSDVYMQHQEKMGIDCVLAGLYINILSGYIDTTETPMCIRKPRNINEGAFQSWNINTKHTNRSIVIVYHPLHNTPMKCWHLQRHSESRNIVHTEG